MIQPTNAFNAYKHLLLRIDSDFWTRHHLVSAGHAQDPFGQNSLHGTARLREVNIRLFATGRHPLIGSVQLPL